jgi:RHS repeat-associated protein
LNIVTQTLVDGIGQVVTSTLQSDPDGASTTDTIYDGVGRVFKKSNPHRSGTLPTDGWTQFTYDALNRVTVVQQPDTSQVSTTYTGNQTTVTDEAGKQRTSQTDALGRLTAVWEDPGTSPHLNYKTEYQYNLLDNLLCAVQKGTDTSPFTDCASAPSAWHPRSFAYDSLSRLTSATNPESGTITYSYDSDGNLSSKVAPLPNVSSGTVTTNYQYDVLNRLTGKTYTGMTMPALLYGYDGATPTGCSPAPPSLTDSYKVGRRTWMCDGSGATSWSHDKMGRVVSQSQLQTITGGTNVTKTTSYDYNLDGSLKKLTYPSLNAVNYTIGGAGRVTQMSDSSNSYVGYSGNAATYTPGGSLVTMTNGHTGSFAGIVTTNSYTSRLQPAVLAADNPTQTIFNLSYGFNPGNDNGNVQQIVNNLDSTRSVAFTYDPLNRISQANTTTTTGANCWGEIYTIDAWGNLTNIAGVPSMTGCHTESQNVPVSANNQITGWCYDGAGNLLDMGSCGPPAHSFVYDAEGHLQSPPAVGAGSTTLAYTYYYDGDGNRVQKCNANPCTSGSTAGTLYWFGTGGEVLDESGRTGTMQEEYVYFNGQRIARRDLPSGNVHYYFSNHLGSASMITDSSGNVQQQTDYYPYGGIAYSSGADTNRYKFTGKERDTESGLDNFGFRNYASTMGRWMTPDRLNLTSARLVNPTNTLNKYVYGGNNPLKYIDKDGKDITIFYRPPSGASGDYGHIMLGALNQATGKVGFLDYYPAGNVNGLGQGPGAFNTGNMSERAEQNAEGKFATLTIQTSPEEAQKVIDLIGALKNGSTPDYSALTNNCTTVCEDVLHDLRLDFGDVFPSSYWADVYNNFSADAQAHPIWTRMMGVHGTPGNEYGNPRNFPGVNNFSQWLFQLYQNQRQQPQPKACVEVDDGLGNHFKSCD